MRHAIDNILSWYFGVPNGDAVAGLRRFWRLEAAWDWRSILTLLLAFSVITATLTLTILLTRRQRPLFRMSLIAVRLVLIGLIGVLALQVSLNTVTYGLPRVALLIDTSASMSLSDRYSMEDQKQLRKAGVSDVGVARIDVVKDALLEQKTSWLERAAEQFEMDLYSFDSSLHTQRVNHPGVAEEASTVSQTIASFNAEGQSTDFDFSLEELVKVLQNQPAAGVILISDGQPTRYSPAAERSLKSSLRKLRLPVFTVGVGSRSIEKDIRLLDVDFEPVGFAGESHPTTVRLQANAKIDEPVEVVVRNLMTDQQVTVTTLEGLQKEISQEILVVLPSLTTGRNDFEIQIVSLAGEADQKNNSRRLRVWGRAADLRALLIDRVPSWEFRHLKATLERDRNVSLKTFLIDSDPAYSLEDRTALSRFPEHVDDYDVVILGDLRFNSLREEFVLSLEKFVKEDGGGLLLLSGLQSLRSFDLASFLGDIHPAMARENDREQRSPMRVNLTAEGHALAVLPLGIEKIDIELLPAVYPVAPEFVTNAAALTLLEGQRVDGRGTSVPLLLSMRYGSGLVMQQTFNDSWRWRAVNQGEFYRKFWSQMIRNLCRQKLLEQLPELELFSDRDEYIQGEAVQVRLIDRRNRFAREDQLVAEIEGKESPSRIISLQRAGATENAFTGTIEGLEPGNYTLAFLPEDGSELRTGWTVVESRPELEHRPLNEDYLQKVSKLTEGRFSYLWELDSLLSQFPIQKQNRQSETLIIPLWNRWDFLMLLIGFLGIEWGLRRRVGID